MFNKLKEKKKEVEAKVAQVKADRQEAKQTRWSSEVTNDDGDFLPFESWRDLYEPKKEKAAGESKDPNAVQRKIFDKLATNMTENVVRGLCEAMSKAVGASAEALRGADPHLSRFLNASDGVFLSYRFQGKKVEKFGYIRGIAADKIAATLVDLLDARAVALGGSEGPDPEMLEKIVASVRERIDAEIAQRQALVQQAIEQSPLFSAVDGADEGVAMLLAFVRSHVEKRVAEAMSLVTDIVGVLAKIVSKHRDVIKANVAANCGPEEQTEEYRNGVRADIIKEIEGKYNLLFSSVKGYIAGLFDVMAATGEEHGDGEE